MPTPTTTPATTAATTTSASPTPSPALRPATAADLAAVLRLLACTGLSTEEVAELLTTRSGEFVVADDPRSPGEVSAVGGLELHGESALLRSVAVRPEWRLRGLGQELVLRLVRRAEEGGLHVLYLLTTTAEHYFPRFGFVVVGRGDVPPEIAATLGFRSTCPASAVVMERRLQA